MEISSNNRGVQEPFIFQWWRQWLIGCCKLGKEECPCTTTPGGPEDQSCAFLWMHHSQKLIGDWGSLVVTILHRWHKKGKKETHYPVPVLHILPLFLERKAPSKQTDCSKLQGSRLQQAPGLREASDPYCAALVTFAFCLSVFTHHFTQGWSCLLFDL